MRFGKDHYEGYKPKPEYFLICVALAAFVIVGAGFYSIITEQKARTTCQFVNTYTEYRASYSSANNECIGVIDGKAYVFNLNNDNIVVKKKEIVIQYE